MYHIIRDFLFTRWRSDLPLLHLMRGGNRGITLQRFRLLENSDMKTKEKRINISHWTFIQRLLLVIVTIFIVIPLKGSNREPKGLETVVIDAGHGGKDPGAVVGRAREKDIVLAIALKLGKYIKENLPDVKVIYTRSTDVFVPLFERSVIANKHHADLFISIHANYCNTPSVKGTETYVLGLHRTVDNLNVAKKENSVILLESDYTTRYEGFNPNLSESYIMFELIQNTHLDQSVAFAGILQETFQKHAQRASRDVRQAGFLVLRETAMPGVLIETGYLSNQSEANYLMTDQGRETLALSIFNSFKSYKTKFESRLQLVSAGSANKETRQDTGVAGPVKSVPEQKKEMQEDTNLMVSEKPTFEPTEKKQLSRPKEEAKRDKNQSGVVYAIQLAASPVRLSLNSKMFKGIENISEIKIKNYYKYYCRESESLAKAKQNLLLIRKKIPDAFIAAFRNGEPISMKEALQTK